MADTEDDVALDTGVAASRAEGGVEDDRNHPDGTSTTGTEPTDEFVGRAAGDDAGDVGESGAEARAAKA